MNFFKRLGKALNRILNRDADRYKPKPSLAVLKAGVISSIVLEGKGMANVKITVVHPTEREDGTPGTPETWRVEAKLHAAPESAWTQAGPALPGAATSTTLQSVAAGTWDFRVFWRDANGESAPATAGVVIASTAKLKPGTVAAEEV